MLFNLLSKMKTSPMERFSYASQNRELLYTFTSARSAAQHFKSPPEGGDSRRCLQILMEFLRVNLFYHLLHSRKKKREPPPSGGLLLVGPVGTVKFYSKLCLG